MAEDQIKMEVEERAIDGTYKMDWIRIATSWWSRESNSWLNDHEQLTVEITCKINYRFGISNVNRHRY